MFPLLNTTLFSTPLLFLVSIGILLYLYFKKCHRYWADKGVPYVKPSNVFLGSVGDLLFFSGSEFRHNLNIYRQLAPHKYGGYYAFHQPKLVVRDPELLKSVLAKDFSHFYDRNLDIMPKDDKLSSMNLFNLTGEKWKILRAKLTATFTSGKMKLMFDTMHERAESMLLALERTLSEKKDPTDGNSGSGSSSSNVIEVKDLMARYTLEVISCCAFGLEANSLDQPDSPIRNVALEALSPSWKVRIFMSLMILFPKILKYTKVKFSGDKQEQFYRKLVEDTIRYREQNGIKKNDFIGMLIAIREEEKMQPESQKLEMSIDMMAAQCFLFMLAGFETSSATISFCLLELSKDTKVQENLRREIEDVLQKTEGQITYEALKMMTYMDQVVAETLRLNPVLTVVPRVCTKAYNIPGTKIVIEPGMNIEIPVVGIHYDSQYYPNPEVFNPDNFSEENKNSRPPYSYLPFGEGPKICIGLRFGLMQIKLALTLLIKNYEFKLSPKMKLPLEYVPGPQQVTNSATGIWLTCNKLEQINAM